MFTFISLILFLFFILFTLTFTFFNFFTFTFFIHITFTTSILHLLTDFAHLTIIIKIQSVDEISFIHDDSIYLSSFSCLNL